MKRFMLMVCISILPAFSIQPGMAQAPATPTAIEPFVTYGLTDWRLLIPAYKNSYSNYRAIILADTSLSSEQKQERLEARYAEIQAGAEKARRAEYEKYREKSSAANSCTKEGGSPKTCHAKCNAPSTVGLYTTADWARGAYVSGQMDADEKILSYGTAVGGTGVLVGNAVCAVLLKQSGNGRKVSYSEAEYRIEPKVITNAVGTEVAAIMMQII